MDTNQENTAAEFEKMLDETFKTVKGGDKVKGIVTSISGNELHIDLGTKHTGILGIDEISDDPSFDINANFKVGDEINVQVMQIHDMDGFALLSKKRIDSVMNWDYIVKMYEEGLVGEAKIMEVVNSGVIALVSGVRVFIPASLTGLSRGGDLATLVGKKMNVKIIDINPERRRAIASVRAAYEQVREAAAQKIWDEIAEGKKYKGVVKSIASYGIFVDIGGVDGLAHITELAWGRMRNPAELFKVGDEVDVYIKEFNREKRRISLGYKKDEDDPWNKFAEQYAVGDLVTVKVMNFMPFGAFTEIMPGVDGLIHISNMSDRRIGNPSEILALGQMVEVKIIGIDPAGRKVSLSMRLNEDAPEEEGEEGFVPEEDAEPVEIIKVEKETAAEMEEAEEPKKAPKRAAKKDAAEGEPAGEEVLSDKPARAKRAPKPPKEEGSAEETEKSE